MWRYQKSIAVVVVENKMKENFYILLVKCTPTLLNYLYVRAV